MTAYMPGKTFCSTSNATGPAMQETVPEVITAVRTVPDGYDVRINDHSMRISVMWADKDFFRLFDTHFLHGTPEAVMSRPNSVAISEEESKKNFGPVNSIGETLLLNNQQPMAVTGVMKDPPNNTVFEFEALIPIAYAEARNLYTTWLGNAIIPTFVELHPQANEESVNGMFRTTFLHIIPCYFKFGQRYKKSIYD